MRDSPQCGNICCNSSNDKGTAEDGALDKHSLTSRCSRGAGPGGGHFVKVMRASPGPGGGQFVKVMRTSPMGLIGAMIPFFGYGQSKFPPNRPMGLVQGAPLVQGASECQDCYTLNSEQNI